MTCTHTTSLITAKAPARVSRRHFLLGSATVGTTSLLRPSLTEAASTLSIYSPTFFTPEEFHFLEHACECLFPQDEHSPGAIELGVPQFIDKQMNTPYGHGELWYMHAPFQSGPPELGYQLPYTPRELYRNAIKHFTSHCNIMYQNSFTSLPLTLQENLLSQLENNHLILNDIPGSTFFEQLRTNTLEGAFSDPRYGGNYHMAGWKMLGFPGARADFMDWINQQGAPYPLGPVSIPSEHPLDQDKES